LHLSLQSLNYLDDHPKQLRMDSISFSISELFHQYHMHVNVLKWTGVIVLLGLTTSTLGVSSNLFHMEKSYWNESECIRIHGQQNFNQTLCSHIRSFRLPQEYYPTVCKYGNRTILDNRQFLDLKSSIKWISLFITQWSYLLSIRQHITRAMYQASNAE
jgi:hypothetical protein